MSLHKFRDPQEYDQAVTCITKAVGDSLYADGKQDPKGSEVKERFDIALKLVQDMRNDLGWSWRRIGDNLGPALTDMLVNGSWTPPARDAWVTDEASGLILPPPLK